MGEDIDPWEVVSGDEFLLTVDLSAALQTPPERVDPEVPREFRARRSSRWLTTPPTMSHAGGVLRQRIAERDLEGALAASRELSLAAQDVIGAVRSRSSRDPLPPIERLEGLLGLRHDTLLGLDLGDNAWDELVDGMLWMWLATDRFDFHGVVAMALVSAGTDDVPWPAFVAERDRPGSAPALRLVEDLWSNGYWAAAEKRGWPKPSEPVLVRARMLSRDAQCLLGATNRVSGREVVEARLVGHTIKWTAHRLRATLAELETAGFASDPPTIEDVGMLLTAAALRGVAAEAGLRTAGTKPVLTQRLIDAGCEHQILRAAVDHSGYHLLALGTVDPALVAMKSVARLWSIAMCDAVGMGTEYDEEDEDAHLWSVPSNGLTAGQGPVLSSRPGSTWALRFPAGIGAMARDVDHLYVQTDDGQVTAIDATGAVAWRTSFGSAAAWIDHLLLVENGPVVTISDRAVAGFHRQSGERLWTWSALAGETLAQQPATDGHHLYVVSSAGLHAIDGVSGQLSWEFLRRRVQAPSISGERITVPIAGGPVHVLVRATGEPVTRIRREGLPNDYHPHLIGSTLILSGRIPQAEQFDAVAIEVTSGNELWRADRHIEKADRLGDHVLLRGHDLRLVDAVTGRTVWKNSSGAWAVVDAMGNPFLVGVRAIARVDPETGRRTASYPRGGGVNRVLGWDGDIVVVDRDVVARVSGPRSDSASDPVAAEDEVFRPGRSASIVWTSTLDQSVDDLAMGPGTVVALTIAGVTAWDSGTGQVRWSQDVWYEHMLLAGDVLVLSGNQEGAIGLDLSDGSMAWAADFGDYAGRFEEAGVGRIVAGLERGGSVCLDPATGLDAEPIHAPGPSSAEDDDGPAFTIEEDPPRVTCHPDGETDSWSVDLPAGWAPDEWCAARAHQVAFSFRATGWHLGEQGSLVVVLQTFD